MIEVTSILIELLGTAIEGSKLLGAEVTAEVTVAGLPVLLVLTPEVRNWDVAKEANITVPLTELLKRKAAMPKDLCGDVTSCINLDAGGGHLKWGPVLMLNQVPDQPFWVGIGFLVGWVTDPGTVDDGVFGVRRDPDEPCRGSGHSGGDDVRWCKCHWYITVIS